jgi:hypothetical protein
VRLWNGEFPSLREGDGTISDAPPRLALPGLECADKGLSFVDDADMGRLEADLGRLLDADMGLLDADMGLLDADMGLLDADMGLLDADMGLLDGDIGRLDAEVGREKSRWPERPVGLVGKRPEAQDLFPASSRSQLASSASSPDISRSTPSSLSSSSK